MTKLEFETTEERQLWRDMKQAIRKHDRYNTKKQYYPYKMDLWERERKEIESHYREQILTLNELRKKEEIESKRLEESRILQECAEALLMLKKTTVKEIYPKKTTRTSQQQPLRRSKRIAQQSK